MGFLKQVKDVLGIKNIENFKNPLFIGPHPDDIEFGCGATISKLKRLGIESRFLIVTDGASGSEDPNFKPETLRDTRYNEARKSAEFLGAKSIDFIGLPDSGYFTEEDVLKSVCPYILKYQPDIVFVCDPNLSTECHRDHLTVAKGVRSATQIVHYPEGLRRHGVNIEGIEKFPNNITIAYYYTEKANKFVKVKKSDVLNKVKALEMHESQFLSDDAKILIAYFKFKASLDGFKHFKGKAEGFKVLPPVYQHVYSEGL